MHLKKVCLTLWFSANALSCNTTTSKNFKVSSEIASTTAATACDFDLDVIVDHPTNALLVDEPGALTAPIDTRHELDNTASPLMTTPLKYEASITDSTNKPKKFAAATVLAALRRLRRFYNTQPFESIAGQGIFVTVPNSCALTATQAALADKTDYIRDPIDEIDSSWNTDGDGDLGSNLRVMRPHWNDIQVHFFPLSPHTRHGCWTVILQLVDNCRRNFFNANSEVTRLDHRQAVADICSGNKVLHSNFLQECPSAGLALSVIPHHMTVYNLLWVDPSTRKFINPPSEAEYKSLGLNPGFSPADIAKLTTVKWSQKQRAKGYVNVWDYIMGQRLYAWDWTQQQAVLNEYFGDNKYWATVSGADRATIPRESVAIDENDKNDCVKWRAPRPQDPKDGSHCQLHRTLSKPLIAIGR